MTQREPLSARRRRRSAPLSGGGGGDGWSLSGLRALLGAFGAAIHDGGWNARNGLWTIAIVGGVALAVFLALGGGVLIGSTEGRFAGTEREFNDCRYATLGGTRSVRGWKSSLGTGGCPALFLP